MRRNRIPAGAAFAAALAAAACRRAQPPAPDPAGGVTLAAPPAAVASPLAGQTSSYTNEMQAQNLRDEAAALGISKFAKPSSQPTEPENPPEPITYREGLERTRASAREFEAERHAIERDKSKAVTLPTMTAAIIPGKKEGAPIELPAEDPGSKGPEKQ